MIDDSRKVLGWSAAGGEWVVLVHGGAGAVGSDRIGEHLAGCREAARVAAALLAGRGCALDAAERAVFVLEDLPCFNAGTGAALNAEGLIELDAALMEGASLRAGAICALPPFRHPIAIARAVLDDGRHVLYAAEGAARFARERGFAPTSSEAMTTPAARERWLAVGSAPAVDPSEGWPGGTVGVVVRDSTGTVAAGTSTGGLMNKRVGRVGDSALLGAGTYADNESGACSATGSGEAIMRVVLAKAATDALRSGVAPGEAARAAIERLGARAGGSGGLILVDATGRVGLARNTPSMAWAAVGAALGEASGA